MIFSFPSLSLTFQPLKPLPSGSSPLYSGNWKSSPFTSSFSLLPIVILTFSGSTGVNEPVFLSKLNSFTLVLFAKSFTTNLIVSLSSLISLISSKDLYSLPFTKICLSWISPALSPSLLSVTLNLMNLSLSYSIAVLPSSFCSISGFIVS